MSGVLLAEATKASFARHETFPLRFGWLRKAYTEAQKNPMVFSEPNATVRLGVGKNMVNAIRYWAQAYKVLQEQPSDRGRLKALVPTEFGDALLADDGWDPWLERPGSQWLLHWQLLRRPCLAPSWWAAFNLFTPEQFEEQQLTDHIIELVAAAGWDAVVEGSVKKDVDCLFRTFAIRQTGRLRMDDLLDCPARELGLLELAAGEHKAWRFVTGPKPALPAAVLVYTCLDYLTTHASGENSISMARLTTDPGSPGRAFRLTESALFASLTDIVASHRDLALAEPGGLRQLVVRADPATLRDQLLATYYAPVPA